VARIGLKPRTLLSDEKKIDNKNISTKLFQPQLRVEIAKSTQEWTKIKFRQMCKF
jgi:hypothetical protein